MIVAQHPRPGSRPSRRHGGRGRCRGRRRGRCGSPRWSRRDGRAAPRAGSNRAPDPPRALRSAEMEPAVGIAEALEHGEAGHGARAVAQDEIARRIARHLFAMLGLAPAADEAVMARIGFDPPDRRDVARLGGAKAIPAGSSAGTSRSYGFGPRFAAGAGSVRLDSRRARRGKDGAVPRSCVDEASCLARPLLLAVPAPAAAELSPAERRISRTVEAEQARTIEPLQRLVDRNSGTLNLEGVAGRRDDARRARAARLRGALGRYARKPDAPVSGCPPTPGERAASASC